MRTPPSRRKTARSAFTLIELVTATAAAGGLLTAAAVTFGPGQPADPQAQNAQLRDATQIRGIGQAFVIFAQSNKDSYPLPSEYDLADHTVAAKGTAKDTTANIMSMLVYAGFLPTDMLISPLESSANIREYQNYQFANPGKAVTPGQALWDPGFSADFTDEKTGNLSYAHQIPARERRARWSTSFSATEPIVGNRGPQIAAVREAGETVPPESIPIYAAKSSMTFRIHGGPDTWEGNIAYNDNHVNFETSTAPADVQYTAFAMNPADGNNPWTRKQFRDVIFFDEPDAVNNNNAYLGIFTHAGDSTKHFRAIWD